METMRIRKDFTFEMAHALYKHEGLCSNIHGHSYRLSVVIKGKPLQDNENSSNGMVIDFADLKKMINSVVVDEFDHAVVLNEADDRFKNLDHGRVIRMPFQPTCELMNVYFVKRIKSVLPAHLELHHVILQETASSYSEWHAEDNA